MRFYFGKHWNYKRTMPNPQYFFHIKISKWFSLVNNKAVLHVQCTVLFWLNINCLPKYASDWKFLKIQLYFWAHNWSLLITFRIWFDVLQHFYFSRNIFFLKKSLFTPFVAYLRFSVSVSSKIKKINIHIILLVFESCLSNLNLLIFTFLIFPVS